MLEDATVKHKRLLKRADALVKQAMARPVEDWQIKTSRAMIEFDYDNPGCMPLSPAPEVPIEKFAAEEVARRRRREGLI